MTYNEYLSTCTNVPALPVGWHWWVSLRQEDRELLTREGTANYTYIEIEIIDRADEVQGSHTVIIPTKNISKYPEYCDIELADGCRKAYNSLYSELKLNFYKALDIDPAV